MITAVDTNIMLDVLTPASPHSASSRTALAEALRLGALTICEPVYAELAANFMDERETYTFFAITGVQLQSSLPQSLVLAGARWLEYRDRRPAAFECAECGNQQQVLCSRCEARMRGRQHMIADFIIGAHASLQADALLTRDRGYFRTYFPDLALV